MSNFKAKKEIFRSNFPLADVQDFLVGYKNSMSKDRYLKNYANEDSNKTSIIDQIEAAIVSVLNEVGIRYRGGTWGRKEKA